MTNEEAIRVLGRMLDEFCNEDAWVQECKDAVDMAIEALKEQSKHDQNVMSKQQDLETLGIKTGETCEDVISRKAAIDVILADKIGGEALIVMNALGDGRLALTLNDACDRHIRDIEKLPSAKPERGKGQWNPFDVPWYQCSVCGAVREQKAFMENFCPNCGADMRGESDGD